MPRQRYIEESEKTPHIRDLIEFRQAHRARGSGVTPTPLRCADSQSC